MKKGLRMKGTKTMDAVRAFVRAINSRDPEQIALRMSEDHLFTDSLGRKVRGREKMRRAWAGYFLLFPDYRIVVAQALEKRNVVALFGTAEGTYAPDGTLQRANHWELPGAWSAVVGDGLVAEWQVYADNTPVLQIMKAGTSVV
ncbi:MAG TPA: nuclear transport factor 2 family protein [Thermoanaerobaculia bacterium]|nr:nuclear transport factor 2 family protein [Thermoanaerobaculia bacterium]